MFREPGAVADLRSLRVGRVLRRLRDHVLLHHQPVRVLRPRQLGKEGSLFGSVTPTDIADELWEKHKVRVDRRKIGGDPIKRIGRFQVPIELFQDVTVEVRTLVVPEGGELPPEEELEALAAADEAAQAPPEEQEKHELSLDELDAAALAQEAQLVAAGELQPSRADVEGELQEDEFDRAVDAGVPEEQS